MIIVIFTITGAFGMSTTSVDEQMDDLTNFVDEQDRRSGIKASSPSPGSTGSASSRTCRSRTSPSTRRSSSLAPWASQPTSSLGEAPPSISKCVKEASTDPALRPPLCADSYSNVIAARRKDKLPVVTPLLGLLPFVGHTVLNVFWLRASPLLLRTHLIPFMIFWGLSFAYLVGLLIVSHVVQAPEIFPWWHILMIWSLFGCVDANLPHWTDGRMQSIVQKGDAQTVGFVWVSVAVALAVYGYFVTDVILDVCDFCDISASHPSPDVGRETMIADCPDGPRSDCLTIKKKKAPTDGGQGGEDKADGGSRGASDKPSGTARRRKQ